MALKNRCGVKMCCVGSTLEEKRWNELKLCCSYLHLSRLAVIYDTCWRLCFLTIFFSFCGHKYTTFRVNDLVGLSVRKAFTFYFTSSLLTFSHFRLIELFSNYSWSIDINHLQPPSRCLVRLIRCMCVSVLVNCNLTPHSSGTFSHSTSDP